MLRRKQQVDYEEEEEEYDAGQHQQNAQNYDEDDKDQIIEQLKDMNKEMRKHFALTIDNLRQQFKDLVEESTNIQSDMLERIKELKAELAELRRTQIRPKNKESELKSTLYQEGPKHPRKLAPTSARSDSVRSSKAKK